MKRGWPETHVIWHVYRSGTFASLYVVSYVFRKCTRDRWVQRSRHETTTGYDVLSKTTTVQNDRSNGTDEELERSSFGLVYARRYLVELCRFWWFATVSVRDHRFQLFDTQEKYEFRIDLVFFFHTDFDT